MLRSAGLRAFIVGCLILLMTIPALFVADVINERADYNRSVARSVGQEWGGPQMLTGPVLVLPVEATVQVTETQAVLDPVTRIQKTDEKGTPLVRYLEVERVERRAPLYVLPDEFKAAIETETEERYRGFFSVPVYRAAVDLGFDYPLENLESHLGKGERILWDEASMQLRVSSNAALRGRATLTAGEDEIALEPLVSTAGLVANLGDPRGYERFDMRLGLFGATRLMISPVGRSSTVDLTSDWPHPSFSGAFLPNDSTITEEGFKANWVIPHLARSLPQIARTNPLQEVRSMSAFGAELYQPNDFYQKSFRAARYGIMFIALTFLTIFLMEGQRKLPTHPVQYILVGLAQLVFFVLMLALAEQFGFVSAYAIAGAATVGLITLFALTALKLGRRSFTLGAILAVLYGVLYLILESADYALLAGSVLAFLTVAATMLATRNESWYADPDRPKAGGWFGRKKRDKVAQPAVAPVASDPKPTA